MAQTTHKIPQNVTTYQGRIIGNFTAKQFIFIGVGAIAGFILFNTPLPTVPKYISIAVVGGVSVIFSLANIQGRTTDVWLTNFIQIMSGTTQRIWKKADRPPAFLLPGFDVTHKRLKKKRTQYELERFIQLWNPVNPSTEYSLEEKEILARVKEHHGSSTGTDLPDEANHAPG